MKFKLFASLLSSTLALLSHAKAAPSDDASSRPMSVSINGVILMNTAVNLPCGRFVISHSISIGSHTSLSGSGACTVLVLNNTSDNMIQSNNSEYILIRDMLIEAGLQRRGGAAIYLKNTFRAKIENVIFTNGTGSQWTAIALDHANDTHISDIEARGGLGNGIEVTGQSARSEDTYISSSNINGFNNGVLLTWASGIYLDKMDILGNDTAGITVSPPKGKEVDGLRAIQILADENKGEGWLFSGEGAITETTLSNCWGSTNGTAGSKKSGLKISNPNTNNLSIISSEFHDNQGYGIEINGGKNLMIALNALFMNGQSLGQTSAGILINSPIDNIHLENNFGGQGGEAALLPHKNLQHSLQVFMRHP